MLMNSYETLKEMRKKLVRTDFTPRKNRMEMDHIEDSTRSMLWNQIVVAENRRNCAMEELALMNKYLDMVKAYKEALAEVITYEETIDSLNMDEMMKIIDDAIKAKTSYSQQERFNIKNLIDIEQDVRERAKMLAELDVREQACGSSLSESLGTESARKAAIDHFDKHMQAKNDFIHSNKCRTAIMIYVQNLTGWVCSDEDVKKLLSQWLCDSRIKIKNVHCLNAFLHYVEYRAEEFANMPFMQERIANKNQDRANELLDKFNALTHAEQEIVMKTLTGRDSYVTPEYLTRIIVDCEKNDPVDARSGGTDYLGYDFYVKREDVEEMSEFIRNEMKNHNQPIENLKIQNTHLVSSKECKPWNKEDIRRAINCGY